LENFYDNTIPINKMKKASEYRPINVLLIFEKVLELVVKEQFEMYLEPNGRSKIIGVMSV